MGISSLGYGYRTTRCLERGALVRGALVRAAWSVSHGAWSAERGQHSLILGPWVLGSSGPPWVLPRGLGVSTWAGRLAPVSHTPLRYARHTPHPWPRLKHKRTASRGCRGCRPQTADHRALRRIHERAGIILALSPPSSYLYRERSSSPRRWRRRSISSSRRRSWRSISRRERRVSSQQSEEQSKDSHQKNKSDRGRWASWDKTTIEVHALIQCAGDDSVFSPLSPPQSQEMICRPPQDARLLHPLNSKKMQVHCRPSPGPRSGSCLQGSP